MDRLSPTLSHLEKHRRVSSPQKKVQTPGCAITVDGRLQLNYLAGESDNLFVVSWCAYSREMSMDKELEALIAAAKKKPMSATERAEQRINFAFGNSPEEYVSSSKASIKDADRILRSEEGWTGSLDTDLSTAPPPRSEPVGKPVK